MRLLSAGILGAASDLRDVFLAFWAFFVRWIICCVGFYSGGFWRFFALATALSRSERRYLAYNFQTVAFCFLLGRLFLQLCFAFLGDKWTFTEYRVPLFRGAFSLGRVWLCVKERWINIPKTVTCIGAFAALRCIANKFHASIAKYFIYIFWVDFFVT